MKFSVNRNLLTERLQSVLAVVSTRTTLPILGNVLLTAEGERLLLAATDLDLSMAGSIPAKVTKAGGTTVPARTFAEIVRELPDDDVQINVNNHRMEIKSGRGVYRMSGISPEEFPRLPAAPEQNAVTIPADELRSMVQRTLYAVSNDETRPALNGILWQANGGSMHMVATDGHRLACVTTPANRLAGLKDELIIPPKALSLVLKMLADDISEVGIVFAEKNVVFRVGDMVITSRLIEGPYPNYRQVIPSGNDKLLKVDAATLAAAVRRVAVLSNSLTRQVKFAVTQDQIELSATNQDVGGEARETISCQYKGDDLEIGYNAHYVLDMLKNFDPGDVVFQLATSVSAALVQSADEAQKDKYLCLVMPLRLAD
ncbi:MAG: DNA polymerase III subunit beta [candidate division Zixibacteria bacterium]|nr:DNA polymerase III subunit beta [candidate division Zixibacteria bacterium]